MAFGISQNKIQETPIAIIDFETTGLTPGYDRIVEVCVVRCDPGQPPYIALDSLVNPLRPMAATEIHGITDAAVAQAPTFHDLSGDLLSALSGCVVSAYNVYFDMNFLLSELRQVGVHQEPPHFCLMYLRPMLGLGKRCSLEIACQTHHIPLPDSHVAAFDAQASAGLLQCYLSTMAARYIRTFSDLATLKSYKFTKSFSNNPYPCPATFSLPCNAKTLSRNLPAVAIRTPSKPIRQSDEQVGAVSSVTPPPLSSVAAEEPRHRIQQYWDTLKAVLADLDITDEEIEYIIAERRRLNIPIEKIRLLHARAFSSIITQFSDDQWLDDRESRKLQKLHQCLSRLGWAPGE